MSKRDASGKKGCCHVTNALFSRLELIWFISRLKISKMSAQCFLAKSFGGVKSIAEVQRK